MRCCELIFLPNILFQNSFIGETVFSLISRRDDLRRSWKNSFSQLSPSFSSLNHAWSCWWGCFAKQFFPKQFSFTKKATLKLFSKKIALLLKLSCAKRTLVKSRTGCFEQTSVDTKSLMNRVEVHVWTSSCNMHRQKCWVGLVRPYLFWV